MSAYIYALPAFAPVAAFPQSVHACTHIYDVSVYRIHLHSFAVSPSVLITSHIGPAETYVPVGRVKYNTVNKASSHYRDIAPFVRDLRYIPGVLCGSLAKTYRGDQTDKEKSVLHNF